MNSYHGFEKDTFSIQKQLSGLFSSQIESISTLSKSNLFKGQTSKSHR